jgi:hypothetical protein
VVAEAKFAILFNEIAWRRMTVNVARAQDS